MSVVFWTRKSPISKGELRWAKKRRTCDKAKKIPHHFFFPLLFTLFSLLISHHCTTVARSANRLPYAAGEACLYPSRASRAISAVSVRNILEPRE